MLIGQDLIRADGPAKVTGQARYVDDVRPDGCLYGFTVRSPWAHARIDGIELDPDFDWTDITVCTAADIPGENVVALMTDDQPVLADGVVRHVAEPVALVAGPDRDRALAASHHVRVAYTPLTPLMDPEVSAGNAHRIFRDDNVYSRITVEHGEAERVLAETDTVITGTYRVGLQEQLYIEPQGMMAIPRADGGVTLFGSMQCPYYIVKALKRVLGHDDLNVVQAVTGGGFGGKEEYPSIVAAHAAVLALKAGRPVKLIYRRDDDLRATTKRHPAIMHYRVAVDRATGKLQAAHVKLLFDGGAYNTLSPVVNSRAVLHALGPYACPHVKVEGLMVATNTPPNGAFRGFGAPQVMFAAERHMDRIARELGRSPLELRRLNLYQDGDVTPSGQRLVDVGATQVLELALKEAEAGLPASGVPDRAGGGGAAARVAPGRGVAIAWHGCGFTGNGEAALKGQADVAIEGDRVVIYTASTDIGQGTDTIFPAIVAEVLGISVDRVANADHDTATVPDSGPTVASRTAMVVGGVVKQAAEKLLAALQAEVGAEGAFDDLLAQRKSAAPLRVRAQYRDDLGLVWDPATYRGDAYPTYGWACVIVDVDVDLDTGEVLYRRLVSATDVGKALNPVLCTGQLEGGALQGLGYATCEEVVLDDQGGMRNNRLTNYIIPTALDAPEMVTALVEIPFSGGPFGAKGIGEIPHDVPAAAVAQAIEAACGAVLDRLPMTPERVLAALQES
ncbi:MAG: xanthine dehydrogenase family protein [Myxococcales bacterium]|nr:xanthine dehydrogenase family protein [Myxococcales bacterium]MCB9545909.1 xanthine dehydrogenase family protein [Myxococcales bacterium]